MNEVDISTQFYRGENCVSEKWSNWLKGKTANKWYCQDLDSGSYVTQEIAFLKREGNLSVV